MERQQLRWVAAGAAFAILANLVNPACVALGGYFTVLAPWLIPSASEELAARSEFAELQAMLLRELHKVEQR